MSHTSGPIQSDTPYTDGQLFFGADRVTPGFAPAAGTSIITRIAAGDYAWAQAVNTTEIYAFNLTRLILRTGFAQDLQEQFGGSVGPVFPSGRPPFTGASQLTPATTNKIPKGFKITSASLVYSIATAAMTTLTCRLDRTTYANNVANSVANLLASGANGLQTATQANPYTTPITGFPALGFEVTSQTALWLEVSAQAAATSVFKLYGLIVGVTFNYN